MGKTVTATTKRYPDPITKDSVNPLRNLTLTQVTIELKNSSLLSLECPGFQREVHRINEGSYKANTTFSCHFCTIIFRG